MQWTVFKRKARRVGFEALGVPARALARGLRRDAATWVFGNRQGYRDNARYLFEHVTRCCPEIRAVWIANHGPERQRVEASGGLAVVRNTFAAFRVVATAGVGVVCVGLRDLAHPITRDMLIVNLFHGIPLKKLGLDTRQERELLPSLPLINRMNVWALTRSLNRYDIVVAASKVCQERFETAFGLPPSRLPICGQARTDILFSGCSHEHERAECQELPERIVLYAPTWRESGINPLEFLDLHRWNHLMDEFQATLLLKPHPLTRIPERSLDPLSRVALVDDRLIDFTHLLYHTDILVTDYSGAICDFALLNRPMLLFAPDLEHYVTTRGMYEPLPSFGGCMIREGEEALIAGIREAFTHPERILEAVSRIADTYYDFFDGRSSVRAQEMIVGQLSHLQ